MPTIVLVPGAFLLGLLVGSFLNVCIYRLPREESVVHPRSRCTRCGHQIRWYDNIPVLSFLLLAARCRDCGASIPFLYPLVEILTAALFAIVASRFGLSLVAVKTLLFISMMLILAFSDVTERLLPDEITLGGAVVGLVFSVIAPLPPGTVDLVLRVSGVRLSPRAVSVAESAVGAATGAGLLWAVAEIYYRIRFREGMGFGDVKMMALIGAFLGLQQALGAVMLASLVGAVLGIIFIVVFRKGMAYELPFGTFLAFAAIVIAVAGTQPASQ
jgi:leader peptidase (prepilin peptidase)/N-methyltransferase